jgi:hypothetical protein
VIGVGKEGTPKKKVHRVKFQSPRELCQQALSQQARIAPEGAGLPSPVVLEQINNRPSSVDSTPMQTELKQDSRLSQSEMDTSDSSLSPIAVDSLPIDNQDTVDLYTQLTAKPKVRLHYR